MLELILDVASFLPQRPGFDPRSGHLGFVVDKVALGQVSSLYLGFSGKTHYTKHFMIIYIIRGWYHRPISGGPTKWTQSHPTLRNKKKTSR
jgi:hypothetical protein